MRVDPFVMDPTRPPEQLSLFDVPAPRPAKAEGARRRPAAQKLRQHQLDLPLRDRPALRLIPGEGEGSGQVRGRLVALPHPTLDRPLPSREEIAILLLQAGADLVAGRISPAGASAIREAAEEALACLEASERDPSHQPNFVRAARALEDLCG